MSMGQKKQRVRLHLTDGTSIEGIMLHKPRRLAGYFTLWGASVFEGPGASHAVPGNVEVARERVLFYQELTV